MLKLVSSLLITLLLSFSWSTTALVLTGEEVFVVSPSEPTSVSLAIKDVLLDFYLVLGRRPVVLSAPPAPGSLPANTTFIFVGSTTAAPWLAGSMFPSVSSLCLTGWESHCVIAGNSSVPGYASTIVATGTGDRGAIFAVYSFAEVVLRVNPYKHFADDVPVYSAPLSVADDLQAVYAPPLFKYRGMFINDEDLLANLFPDPLGLAAIDLREFNRLIETLLRAKGNLIIPATNPFPDQQVNALVARRGAVLSFHHYDLTGANVFAWPLPSTDWSWAKNSGTMSALYQSAIAAQTSGGGGEILWSVGLRGLNDEPYPCTTQKECGAAVSAAMSNQTAWIRSTPGQENATLIFYTWQEDLELLANGYITLPDNVDLIFTDAGFGYIRVNSNWTKYCNGVYYHTAMYDGSANQLGEMIPVDRIASQFAPVVNESKSTTIMIDNVSDLKPALMTTAAVLALAWDAKPFFNAHSPAIAATNFYASFASQQFHLPGGATDPVAVEYANLWVRFFNIPYIYAGISDNFLARRLSSAANAAGSISKSGTVPGNILSGVNSDVNQLSNNTDPTAASVLTALSSLVSDATTLASSIPASRLGFYTSQILTQFSFHLYAVQSLVSCRDALVFANNKDWNNARLSSQASLTSANNALASLRNGEAASAPEIWRGMYMGDYLSNFQQGRDQIVQLVSALNAPGESQPLPAVDFSNLWYLWDIQWEHDPRVAAAYPLSQRFDPNVAFSRMVRTNCVFSDVDAGNCETNPTGGIWKKNANVGVTLQILTSQTIGSADNFSIRYTLDGSTPTAQSPAYSSAIKVDSVGSDIVTVTAAPFDSTGEIVGPMKTTTWKAM
jgi:hypothetical protein